jgi:hypothetical protein
MDSLIHNHPFAGGNKRSGTAATGLFLLQNGYRLDTSNAELETFTRHVTESGPWTEWLGLNHPADTRFYPFPTHRIGPLSKVYQNGSRTELTIEDSEPGH